jgi:SprT-like family
MNITEIKSFLTRLTFTDLSLIKADEASMTYTFSFGTFTPKAIPDKPTMAANGTVAVYTLEDVGKLGVSPSNKVVRFIDAGKRSTKKVNDEHLSKSNGVSPELEALYQKAQVSETKRQAFMKGLWNFYNETKFQSRMKIPKLLTGPKVPGIGSRPSTRACHVWDERTGKTLYLWVNTIMWNARLPFFCEVFLHEMCHEAVLNIDQIESREAAGHGKDWQRWMVHVGLDPRRFDPTDDYEYKTGIQRTQEEEKLTDMYGPRVDASYFKTLRKMSSCVPGPAILQRSGRPIKGVLDKAGSTYAFKFRMYHTGSPVQFTWKNLKEFNEKGLPNLYHAEG